MPLFPVLLLISNNRTNYLMRSLTQNLISVNHTLLTSVTHEDAIDILKEAGPEVTLTVKHYKSAAPFLLKNVRQFIPEQDTSGVTGTYNRQVLFLIANDYFT